MFESVEDMQAGINDGTVWHMEGSIGRSAMSAIENGFCILPSVYIDPAHADKPLTDAMMQLVGTAGLRKQIRDAYGNVVPFREMLQEGTKGTRGYAERVNPEFYLASKTLVPSRK